MNKIMTVTANVDATRQLLTRVSTPEASPPVHFARHQMMKGERESTAAERARPFYRPSCRSRHFHLQTSGKRRCYAKAFQTDDSSELKFPTRRTFRHERSLAAPENLPGLRA